MAGGGVRLRVRAPDKQSPFHLRSTDVQSVGWGEGELLFTRACTCVDQHETCFRTRLARFNQYEQGVSSCLEGSGPGGGKLFGSKGLS